MPNQVTITNAMRQTNIELLRIISMLLIVAHHFAAHGGFEFDPSDTSLNYLFLLFIDLGGKVGVNAFVLISGYFLSQSSMKTGKVIKLWLQVFTYSVILYSICLICGIETVGCDNYLEAMLPITHTQWWFAGTFFVLYLISPYINVLLDSLTQKQHQGMLLLLFTIWCLIPTFTLMAFESNYLWYFVFLYCLAAYIRKYGLFNNLSASKLLLIALGVYILTFAFRLLCRLAFDGITPILLYETQSLSMLAVGTSLFLAFLKLDIKYSKVINLISSATFGVYLIHDHMSLREYLWKGLLRNSSYAESNMLIPFAILAIAGVYIVCTMIELIRIHTLEKLYMPGVTKLAAYIDSKLGGLLCRNNKPS
ncbi:MAG: acyltransferase [Saccharofermentans sp.]|nr:acyltransferase [Saccharofermentans sp.]